MTISTALISLSPNIQRMNNVDRHDRVASLVKELAAEFIRREANTTPLITVTHVTVSSDYKQVTVYFTTIPDEREDDALIFLKRAGGELRQYIKKKSNLKVIPFVTFAVDRGERHRQHIDEIAREMESDES